MKTFTSSLLFVLLLFGFISCNRNSSQNSRKMSPTDPFKNTITPSQFFNLDAKTSQVVEGEKGTVISMPKGCFLDEDGKVVEGPVKVELTEALSAADMILSNLTTTSNGKMLESSGMIYFRATLPNGKEAKINPDKPIYMEIPTENRKAGMQLYKGIRDEKGNMNWVDPKPLENYLIPIKMDLLDFLPEGFESEVQKGIPYKNHKVYTKELADSLYYSFSANIPEAPQAIVDKADLREPMQGGTKSLPKTGSGLVKSKREASKDSASPSIKRGIDPAMIKTIHSKEYENTLLSTREFEKRLQSIFKTCDKNILEIYIFNTSKNMWELDEMAAKRLGKQNPFAEFAKEKLTNVRFANEAARNLSGYYEKHLSQLRLDLEKLQKRANKIKEKEDKKIEEVKEAYHEILIRREKYRMEKYGVKITENGWKNIDTGTAQKPWMYSAVKITVKNSESFDRVNSYIFIQSIRSLYGLLTEDSKIFYTREGLKEMALYKGELVAIIVAFKGDQAYYATQKFISPDVKELSMEVKAVSKKELKKYLEEIDTKNKINSITIDLSYQEIFYKEELRQKRLMDEYAFLSLLYSKAFPCGGDQDGGWKPVYK